MARNFSQSYEICSINKHASENDGEILHALFLSVRNSFSISGSNELQGVIFLFQCKKIPAGKFFRCQNKEQWHVCYRFWLLIQKLKLLNYNPEKTTKVIRMSWGWVRGVKGGKAERAPRTIFYSWYQIQWLRPFFIRVLHYAYDVYGIIFSKLCGFFFLVRTKTARWSVLQNSAMIQSISVLPWLLENSFRWHREHVVHVHSTFLLQL